MKEITISKEDFKKISRFVFNEFKEEVFNEFKGNDETIFLESLTTVAILTFSERLEQLLFDENQKTND